jgi:hypothetical protein
MVTIFCDFCRFSANKIGVFLKNQCYDKVFFITQLCFVSNTPIFSPIFLAKIF